MTWKPVPELFELVTWADIAEGDHVWSMGGVCVITRSAFRNDDEYDRSLSREFARFGHRNESGSEYAPSMELAARVPRLIPPGRPGDVSREVVRAIASLVAYNWSDEEDDYNHEALEDGNSRDGHIFESLMLVQRWLEASGYPHAEPRITPEPDRQES